ncbi:apbE family protein [Firmicutes bacterium CAG:94]|nr:apbE family protein [Firmicutes bacterium CAG:94]
MLGLEDSLPLLEQFDSQALFITQERQIYLTSGLEDAFTLSSGDYTLAGTV